ncbi:MAG: NAD-dependent epimerase/dehydratase family protein [Bacteroidia bacterium]
MKVIITGATGMVGKGVLLECLDHESVTQVLTIGRSPVGKNHPKLKELIHEDFSDFSSARELLEGYDACYCCMGVSVAGMSEEDYTKLTYEYTIALAKELVELNPQMTITYVSGEGTDSSEEGRSMWARVKGKTENALVLLGFNAAYMFRPGLIIPLRGIKSRTRIYQFVYDYFMWLVKLIKWLAPNSVVNTTQLGLAMINVTLKGHNSQILRPRDIISLSQDL